MLMSTSAAPAPTTLRAVSAKARASRPTSWTAWGCNALALGAHRSFGVALKIGLGRDHLGEDQGGPKTARDPPHRQIADARHRREQRPSLKPDRPDGDGWGGA